jgi:maltose alpha-D-glucosyltransferase/alpha-amylase
MGEFLTERARFRNAVPILGTVDLFSPENPQGTPLAVLQALVGHQGSAWDFVVDHLRRIIARGEDRRYLGHMITLLGQRTAEMHRALLTETGDPAFDPEPVDAQEARSWADRVAGEAEETFELLEGQLDTLAALERQVAQRLLAFGPPILERVRSWRVEPGGLRKSRYHGDYHLGQVLIAEEDFIIIDFEGEPARDLEDRRRKHSVLKDVAGLLRSFDYAAFVAASESLEPSGLSPLDLTLLQGELRESSCELFLEGYQQVMGEAGDLTGRQMLELFLWEKAFYELRYEIRTRPPWVAIPLRSLERYFLG